MATRFCEILSLQQGLADINDLTKLFAYDTSGATTSTTTTLDFNQTSNRTITIPDATTTMVGTAGVKFN